MNGESIFRRVLDAVKRRMEAKRLAESARYERENACLSCGKQKKHRCGMGACVDYCDNCDSLP
jgi:hypothetical protein